MDHFKEQIVPVKKTGFTIVTIVAIWVLAALITAVCLFAMFRGYGFFLLVAAGVIYCAYKLNATFNIEFEYISTNGVVDIDKIINKSSRKCIVSFECKEIESIAKFDATAPKKSGVKTCICTDDYENAIAITVTKPNMGRCIIVFSPNDALKDSMRIFVPRNAGEF